MNERGEEANPTCTKLWLTGVLAERALVLCDTTGPLHVVANHALNDHDSEAFATSAGHVHVRVHAS